MKKTFAVLTIVMLVSMLFGSNFAQATSGDVLADPRKGLAMAYSQYQEDLIPFNGQNFWWYNWQSNYDNVSNYVPMSWCGEDPILTPTTTYRYVLLFNEPEVTGQCQITVSQAVTSYMALKAKYPNVKWVVGNQIWWGDWGQWLVQFKNECLNRPRCVVPTYWGIHIYVQAAPGEETYWFNFIHDQFHILSTALGNPFFWVTEFAEINGNLEMDHRILTHFIDGHGWQIKRYAYFTNRSLNNNDPGWPGWNIHLFDWYTGATTPIGDWYIPYQ